jgi:hypothetical protein
LERVATTAMLSMLLFVGSLFFLGGFALFSLESDANPWLLALTSNFLRWDCTALKGTPARIDALLRAPSILVPALICAWSQKLNMPQRLTRLFVLHCIYDLILGFLLIMAGVKLGSPF